MGTLELITCFVFVPRRYKCTSTWTTWTKSSEGSLYTQRTEAIEKSDIEGINTRRELRFTLYIFFEKTYF